MPELPEVETVRASLARDLIGKKVKSVSVTNGRLVRRHKTAIYNFTLRMVRSSSAAEDLTHPIVDAGRGP